MRAASVTNNEKIDSGSTDLSVDELEQKSTWTNIWGIYQFVGAPMAMIVGVIMDRTRTKVMKETGDKRLAQLQSTVGVETSFFNLKSKLL